MSFEIEGLLHKKFETESKSATFQAREFVIQTDGQYPQYVKFQLTQDKCALIDAYNEGSKIKVNFDLRGREWNEKFFTNLNAWKVGAAQDIASATPPPAAAGMSDFSGVNENYAQTPAAPAAPAANAKAEDFDDLPF